jgi:two-component system, OmpR family, sensor kinase
MLPRSLRWQIQLWHAALLAATVAVVLAIFYNYERQARVARIDSALNGPLIALLPQVIPVSGQRGERPPPRRDADADADADDDDDDARSKAPFPPKVNTGSKLLADLEASGHYIVVQTGRGTEERYRSARAPVLPPFPADIEAPRVVGRWNGANRELLYFMPRGECVVLGRLAESLAAELRGFALKLLSLGVGLVAVGLVVGHFITGRALRPLRGITGAAQRIAAGHWAERIAPEQAPAELSALREVLNHTFEKLSRAYEEQRRFTADASHELGTPVAVVLAKTQHALARPRTVEEYTAALQACRRAAERMKALTRDLLDLAALDAAAPGSARRVECDLAELGREAVTMVETIAAERQATIEVDLPTLLGRVEPLGLGQVLVNLLANAMKHNPPGVRVHLALRRQGEAAIFTVSDNGAGLPPEALGQLFERFFRADRARTREQGGTGLGLAIVREIVRQHGGEVTAVNGATGGAVFTVRLPIQ